VFRSQKNAFFMSDITTPRILADAVRDLQRMGVLTDADLTSMQGDKPVYIHICGQHCTTYDGKQVRLEQHTAMVDFDQTICDEQVCLVQPLGEDGQAVADAYNEKYAKLTLHMVRIENNVLGLLLVLGVVAKTTAPSNISISLHMRKEESDLACFREALAYLQDKSKQEMIGAKAYTVAIDMGKMSHDKLCDLAHEFAQIMGYGVDGIPASATVDAGYPDWMDGTENWHEMSQKFDERVSAERRVDLLNQLENMLEVRVVGLLYS